MKNYEYWRNFVKTGKIDDYLHYIACTNEECIEDILQGVDKEGGVIAGIEYRDGNGPVSNASW